MSSSYSTLVGNPPVITSNTWRDWYFSLLFARVSECLVNRTTTYHFDNTLGDDSTGDGSIATPYKTIAKAQALHDAADDPADIRFRFKRGEVWRETTGLVITKDDVTIDDYGTGNKPLFNNFTLQYPDGTSWTAESGNVYKLTSITEDISWFREEEDLDNPYSRQDSVAHVEATEGSFYNNTSTNVLYIHRRGGGDPTDDGRDYEAVISAANSGVRISSGGCVVKNIRADGWGMSISNTSTQREGIQSDAVGTDANANIKRPAQRSGIGELYRFRI